MQKLDEFGNFLGLICVVALVVHTGAGGDVFGGCLEWNAPQASGIVALSSEKYCVVFGDDDLLFGESGLTSCVAELPD